jgi:hypothetical protein
MARQTGPFFLEGLYGNICFYKVKGRYLVRQKSTLTGKRVKTSAAYRVTMVYARMMSGSSKIASAVYKALPPHWKQFWMYRAFVGEAMEMLKVGKVVEEIRRVLWERYAAEFAEGYAEENEFQHPVHITTQKPILRSRPVRVCRTLAVTVDGRLQEVNGFIDRPGSLPRRPVLRQSVFRWHSAPG